MFVFNVSLTCQNENKCEIYDRLYVSSPLEIIWLILINIVFILFVFVCVSHVAPLIMLLHLTPIKRSFQELTFIS